MFDGLFNHAFGAGHQTQAFTKARQAPHHWGTNPALCPWVGVCGLEFAVLLPQALNPPSAGLKDRLYHAQLQELPNCRPHLFYCLALTAYSKYGHHSN